MANRSGWAAICAAACRVQVASVVRPSARSRKSMPPVRSFKSRSVCSVNGVRRHEDVQERRAIAGIHVHRRHQHLPDDSIPVRRKRGSVAETRGRAGSRTARRNLAFRMLSPRESVPATDASTTPSGSGHHETPPTRLAGGRPRRAPRIRRVYRGWWRCPASRMPRGCPTSKPASALAVARCSVRDSSEASTVARLARTSCSTPGVQSGRSLVEEEPARRGEECGHRDGSRQINLRQQGNSGHSSLGRPDIGPRSSADNLCRTCSCAAAPRIPLR